MSLIHAFYHFFLSHLSWKLTYLPKKYHQYVVPGVRRVYLDTSTEAILQKKLTKADARIRKLEAEQETLLKQCEQHMSAARAHAEGEKKERRRADKLEQDFDAVTSQSFEAGRVSEIYIEKIAVDRERLKHKYQKLKQHCRELEEE
jgi:outer membrane murein-binding lipoprotein Lpp